ncbi:MAG: hypothetical protein KJ587_14810 [Alphaproteobacteria bacterium]|nr:hypothetical protein [Alphaproteobacteria bacterium]
MLELAWDHSGRQLWQCEGWQLPGQREMVPWNDRAHPLTAAIHALACAYLTAEVIAEIIASISPDASNVIDLQTQRELRKIECPRSGGAANGIRAPCEQNQPESRAALPAQLPDHN